MKHIGSKEWIWQRITAVFMFVISFCLFVFLFNKIEKNAMIESFLTKSIFDSFLFKNMFLNIALILLCWFTCHHKIIGLKIIAEDYIPNEKTRSFVMFFVYILTYFVFFAFLVASVFSYLKQ